MYTATTHRSIALAVVLLCTVLATCTVSALPFQPYPLWSAPVSPQGAAGPPLVVGDTVYATPRIPFTAESVDGAFFGAVAIQRRTGALKFKVRAEYAQGDPMPTHEHRGSIGVTEVSNTSSAISSAPASVPAARPSNAGRVMPAFQSVSSMTSSAILALGFSGTNKVFAFDAHTGAARWTYKLPKPSAYSEQPLVHNIAAAAGVVVVQTKDDMIGLDAATGVRKWGPNVLVGGRATGAANLKLHSDRLVITCTGESVQAYDVATGGLMWIVGSPDRTYYAGSVSVANGLVTVNGDWVNELPHSDSGFNATTTVIDANSGFVYGSATSACGDAAIFAAASNSDFSIVMPSQVRPCPIKIFNVSNPAQFVSLPEFTAAIGGVMVGDTAVVTLQKTWRGQAQLTGLDARTGRVRWSMGSALSVFEPVVIDGVLYGSSYSEEAPEGAGSIMAIQISPPRN